VVKGLQAGWGACSRTVALEGTPLAISYWRDTIAVGLNSCDIIILNVVTGSQMATLSGHTNWVRSLTFLLGGTSIISGGNDHTLKLWDVQTGGVVRTFHGHTDYVPSASISPDQTTIASGSCDKTICLWDIQTGECNHVIQQQWTVDCVCFSPMDPQHLVSVSQGVVKQWDISSHQIGSTYEGSHVAFSLDGTHFISSGRNVATVQNSSSGVVVATCYGPNGDLCCCCFSPNGKVIAAAVGDTAYIWDITTSGPYPIETFTGHTDTITSLTFSSSSSLISASRDQSVKFWQVGTFSMDPVACNPKSTLAPIRSITLQTKDGIAISSDSDGVVKTWDLSAGHCKASY
jgi:WD40 repeat protein